MSIHLIDIEQLVHTCPANDQPHAYDIRRTLVHTTPGGPCRRPITIRSGDTITTTDCGRHEPAERQCGACRPIVVERHITSRDMGHQPLGPTCPARSAS